MIVTTYYAKLNDIPDDFNVLLISRGIPTGIKMKSNYFRVEKLYPSAELLKGYKAGEISDMEYTDDYLKKLKRNIKTVDHIIKNAKNGQNYALVCYEKPGDFCHRHILGKFITARSGIAVNEMGTEDQIKIMTDIMQDRGYSLSMHAASRTQYTWIQDYEHFGVSMSCMVWPQKNEFQLISYVDGLLTLSTGVCGSFTNDEHFAKFEAKMLKNLRRLNE